MEAPAKRYGTQGVACALRRSSIPDFDTATPSRSGMSKDRYGSCSGSPVPSSIELSTNHEPAFNHEVVINYKSTIIHETYHYELSLILVHRQFSMNSPLISHYQKLFPRNQHTAPLILKGRNASQDPLRAKLYSEPTHFYKPTELMSVPWVAGHSKDAVARDAAVATQTWG